MNDQEGSLPERGGKLGGRAHQQTLFHKAVPVGEKSLVWKKTHPLALAANTLLRTHIHPLPSNPLNPDYPQHALRVTHTPFIHSEAIGHSYTHSWAIPTAHTA